MSDASEDTPPTGRATYTRRRMLTFAATGAAGLLTWRCGDDGGATPTPEPGDGDTGTSEPTPTPDPVLTSEQARITKGPYALLQKDDGALLRFESLVGDGFVVELAADDGEFSAVPAETRVDDLTYEWANLEVDYLTPDLPGVHVLHSIELRDYAPGATIRWRVTGPDGSQAEGSLRTQPAESDDIRFGWIADTMWPRAEQSAASLAALEPDVFVHGGDMQYQSNPFDTWNDFFGAMATTMRRAAGLYVIGNHEFEDQNEVEVMYERLFSGQGEAAAAARYFCADFGQLRFICLDSESGDLGTAEGTQATFLRSALQPLVDRDGDARNAIVCMHRPVYSLSKHYSGDTSKRDVLHGICTEASVRLVFCGHAHCYERFLVDGVTYVVDGGGGASLYNPDEDLERALAERPADVDARQFASRTIGVTTLDVTPAGEMTLRRWEATEDGPELMDEVAITG